MKFSNTLGLASLIGSSLGYPAIRPENPHSEEFYLVAYKIPENRIDQDGPLYQMTSRLQNVGFQPLVYNNDHEVVLDANIDSTVYNITGVVNQDLSLQLTRFPQNSTYLTVTPQLDITHQFNESVGLFSVYHNDLIYDECNQWIICQKPCNSTTYSNDTSTGAKTVVVPKGMESNCQETEEVVLRAYGYTSSHIIPDYPLY